MLPQLFEALQGTLARRLQNSGKLVHTPKCAKYLAKKFAK